MQSKFLQDFLSKNVIYSNLIFKKSKNIVWNALRKARGLDCREDALGPSRSGRAIDGTPFDAAYTPASLRTAPTPQRAPACTARPSKEERKGLADVGRIKQ